MGDPVGWGAFEEASFLPALTTTFLVSRWTGRPPIRPPQCPDGNRCGPRAGWQPARAAAVELEPVGDPGALSIAHFSLGYCKERSRYRLHFFVPWGHQAHRASEVLWNNECMGHGDDSPQQRALKAL
ncbi:hypothetical protein NDU88_002263 [Pleurodeles waltl]|uniref:Uncharacterized protein n=1 Tax=Pleurodeles waltl TaxID=8319 RepID=A0AAV7SCQ7_PLEWA|nr:hypothetical protein NDU88_002263 [Pleurodeles waltl]